MRSEFSPHCFNPCPYLSLCCAKTRSGTNPPVICYNNEKELHRLAKALLKHETLTGEDLKLAVSGKLTGQGANDKLVKGAPTHQNEKKQKQEDEAKEHNPSIRPEKGNSNVLDAPANGAVGEGGRIENSKVQSTAIFCI